MTEIELGKLIAIIKDSCYYHYLILSEPMFFGCRWAYAFHRTSHQLLTESEVLTSFGEGFHALIDFESEIDEEKISIIGKGIDTTPYQIKRNSKVRIDKPDGGHMWYIFDSSLQIIRKQNSLKSTQFDLPVANRITCGDALLLIDKKWKTEQVVKEEGQGQFPI